MITLLTGSPGGGKSLYAVSKLIPQYLKEGRTVYTNINGLCYYSEVSIHGQIVRKNLIKVKDDLPVWEKVLPLPDDLDWRSLPAGSVVIYDEAQQFFPASGRTGLSNDGRIVDLDTHRHKGYDLIYITQHPTLLDSHIRKFVSHHIHLYRKMGAKRSILYEWNHCVSSPEHIIGDTEAFLRSNFSFNKNDFSFYKSSEIHTAKFRLPPKFIFFSVFLIFIILGLIYFGFKAFSGYDKYFSDNSVVNSVNAVSSSSVPSFGVESFNVTGYSCSLVDDSCSCSDGSRVINVPTAVCYRRASASDSR